MTTKTPATRIFDRKPFSAIEVRDLNRASRILAKTGAISVERLAKVLKTSTLDAAWRLHHIGAELTASGLYVWAE